MSLLKIHRILIGSGIAVCVLFTIIQVLTYTSSSDTKALIRAAVATFGAIGMGVYLRSIRTL